DILSAFKDKINEIAIKPSILKEKYNKITDNLFFATIVPMFFIVLGLGLTIPVAQNETQRLRQDLVQYNLKQNYKDDLSKVVGLLNITTLESAYSCINIPPIPIPTIPAIPVRAIPLELN
ncbi:TPA: hypothetical protein ACGDLR_003121, partial [Acinetobacter baumannii]